MSRLGSGSGTERLTLPDAITLSRIPIAAALVAASVLVRPVPRALLVSVFAIGVATDVADGWCARRLGLASDRGAKLDCGADLALAAGLTAALAVTVTWPIEPWVWWAVGLVGAVRLASMAILFSRFGVASLLHTWANKASGVVIGVAGAFVLAQGELGGWPVAVACAICGAAAAEEFAMVAAMRDLELDRRGFWDHRETTARPPRIGPAATETGPAS